MYFFDPTLKNKKFRGRVGAIYGCIETEEKLQLVEYPPAGTFPEPHFWMNVMG